MSAEEIKDIGNQLFMCKNLVGPVVCCTGEEGGRAVYCYVHFD